jgi:hypothetical protein
MTVAKYINDLFTYSNKIVIIYSFNDVVSDVKLASHLKHRPIDKIKIPNDWEMIMKINNDFPFNGKNGSYSDFYIYKKQN